MADEDLTPLALPSLDVEYVVVDGELDLAEAYATVRRPGLTDFNVTASRLCENVAREAGLPDPRPAEVWTVWRGNVLLVALQAVAGTKAHRLNWHPRTGANMTLRRPLKVAKVNIESGVTYRVPVVAENEPKYGPCIALLFAKAVAMPIAPRDAGPARGLPGTDAAAARQ